MVVAAWAVVYVLVDQGRGQAGLGCIYATTLAMLAAGLVSLVALLLYHWHVLGLLLALWIAAVTWLHHR